MREPKGLLVGGIAAGVAGTMADLLSPLYATSFHRGFGLTSALAGVLVTAALGAMAVVEFGLAHSIGERNLKAVATVGIVVAAGSLLYISEVSDDGFWSLFAGMVVLGLGCGLASVAGSAALSFADNSERAFGLLSAWYMVFVFVMMSTNPVLRQMYPIVLPYAAMIAVQLLCLALIWWKLPDTRALAEEGGAQAAATGGPARLKLFSAIPLMLGAAMALSEFALVGLWTFAEEIGTGSGLSAQTTATFLGTSQLVGLLGTMAPWLLGRFVGRAVLGAAGLLLCAVGILLVTLVRTPTAYIGGNLAVNLGYWVVLPLGMSVAADLDRNSGRLVAFVMGLSSVGLALGPTLAGPLLGGDDTTLGGWVFGIIGLIAVPFIVVPARAADRAVRTAQAG